MNLLKKISNCFLKKQYNGDIFHETLKKYNFKPEQGIIFKNKHGGYSWKKTKKESWQNPKE